MQHIMKKCLAACIGALAAWSVQAQVVLPFYDGFNYAAGGNLAANGSWVSGSGSGTIKVNASNLAYNGLAASVGNDVSVIPGSSSARTYVNFTSQTSGTVYLSFLLKVNTAPSAQRLIGYAYSTTSSSSTPYLGLFVTSGGQIAVGISTSSPQFTGSGLTAGATSFIVVSYTFGASDSAQVWVNPASLGGTAPGATGSFTATGVHNSSLAYFHWNTPSAGTGGGSYEVDELRIGSSWGEVTPAGSVVTPTNAPFITQVSLSADAVSLQGTNGNVSGPYVVLTTSNLALPRWQWSAVASNSFDTNGNFRCTNVAAPGFDRAFYQLYVGAAPPAQPVAPGITNQPQSQSVVAGQNVTFSVTAGGTAPLGYQWYFNTNTALAGATNSLLTLNNVQTNNSGGYSVIVTNIAGSVSSAVALLTVSNLLAAPTISTQPQSQSVAAGQSVSFNVVANGTLPLSYQWFYNTNTARPNATNASLTLNNVTTNDAGGYAVLVTNTLGSVTSMVASLTVSGSGSTNLFPVNSATSVCVDTTLRINFESPPSLGTSGLIRIYNATTLALYDSIDVSSATQTKQFGGTTYNYYPVLFAGNTAHISLHSKLLYGQSYYVTIDSTVFQGVGAWGGISGSNAWFFTTKAAAPASGTTNLTVAADGSGDFCTVQGAIDFVPSGNTTPRTIHIQNGVYREIVYNNGRNNLTLAGQDRNQTVVTYANNNTFNGGNRYMFRSTGNDIIMENLTLTNSTPQGGSQAESLRVDGARFIFWNGELDSLQDTILVNSSGNTAYFQDCLVLGNVDYVWGQGTIYFTNCEMRSVARATVPNGYICQPRNPSGRNGFAFVNCRLTGSDGSFHDEYLARNNHNDATPACQCVFLNCQMSTNNIHPAGWLLDGTSSPTNMRFWEYQSTDLTGTNLVDVSQRPSWSVQLTAAQAAAVRDLSTWFSGWVPHAP